MTEPCVEETYLPPARPHLVVLPGLADEPIPVDRRTGSTPVDRRTGSTPVDRERWVAAWEHRPLLLGLARQRVATHDAEDVVSEAMLRAATTGELRDEALRPWLVTTTLRLCADGHRRSARERRRDQRLAAWETETVPAAEDEVVDLVQAEWLATQVDRLPERQARAIWLRAHGHDIASIAVQMVLPYKTVESLLARGRHSLRGWAGAALLVFGGWRTIAKRKVQFHVAVATIGAAGEVAFTAAKVAGSIVGKSF